MISCNLREEMCNAGQFRTVLKKYDALGGLAHRN